MARYRFSGDRKGQHPRAHLARFRGWMHADGYAGFEDLYRSGAIREVACMAHVRRKFVDIHRSQGSPIAEEAIGRIAQLYAIEKEARGSPPDRRAELRRTHAAPVFDDLKRWLAIQITTISGNRPSLPRSAMPLPAWSACVPISPMASWNSTRMLLNSPLLMLPWVLVACPSKLPP